MIFFLLIYLCGFVVDCFSNTQLDDYVNNNSGNNGYNSNDNVSVSNPYGSGTNFYGQISTILAASSSSSTILTPTLIRMPKPANITSVVAGEYLSWFLDENGLLYGSGMNLFGSNLSSPTLAFGPTPVSLGSAFQKTKSVSVGGDFSLFLVEGGKVLGTGANSNGNLGLGDTIARTTPTLLLQDALCSASIVSIGSGYSHSLFVSSEGRVYGSGSNYNGKLGLGIAGGQRITPTLISAVLSTVFVVAVSGGYDHTLFLSKEGFVFGCGSTLYNQLGSCRSKTTPYVATPTPIPELTNIKSFSSSQYLSVFLNTRGKVYVAGTEFVSVSNDEIYKAQQMNDGCLSSLTVTAVAAGGRHAVFVATDANLYGLGDNDLDGQATIYGIMGLGYVSEVTTATLIASGNITNAISTSYGHTLFVAKGAVVSYADLTSPHRNYNPNAGRNLAIILSLLSGAVVVVVSIITTLICRKIRRNKEKIHSLQSQDSMRDGLQL